MYRYANSVSARSAFIAGMGTLCTVVLVTSCSIIDVETLDTVMHPSVDLMILSEDDSVWIEFGLETDHARTERCIDVRDDSGSVSFDARWKGQRLTIVPIEPWTPGTRYEFLCEGTVYTPDNRSFPVRESVRFYSLSASGPPMLSSWSPPDEAVVGLHEPIILQFNKPIDGAMLERFITVSPPREILVGVGDDESTVTVNPADGWEGMNRYRWSVDSSMKDAEGLPLGRSFSGTFRTYLDTRSVGDPDIFAARILDASVRYPIDSIDRDMGVLFSFPEPVDTDSFRDCFRIEPAININFRFINGSAILVYPDRGEWKPGREYEVTIREGLSDTAGNKTEMPFSFSFTAIVPLIEILSIGNTPPGSKPVLTGKDFSCESPAPIAIDISMMSHSFTIRLSESLSALEAERLVKALSISSFFPPGTGNPALATILPVYGTTNQVTLDFRGFTVPGSDPEERILYKLTIKGGEQGFRLDNGGCLESDFEIMFETVH